MLVLAHTINSYNSVEITDDCTVDKGGRSAPISTEEFERRLFYSLNEWKKQGRKGIWLRIDKSKSELIPVAVRVGFDFHHAKKGYVMLTAWVAKGLENKLPPGPSHFIGVAGFVLNSKGEVLCIKEMSGPSARYKDFWKLPGGLVDPHEDIRDAVVREVKEETGLDSQFVQLATIQEIHHTQSFGGLARAGTTDLYCICILKALDESQKIIPQPEEVSDCKWIKLDEFLNLRFYNQPETLYYNMFRNAAAVAKGERSGLGQQHLKFGGRLPGSNTLYSAKL